MLATTTKLSTPLNAIMPTCIRPSPVSQGHGESPPSRCCLAHSPCLTSAHQEDPMLVRLPQRCRATKVPSCHPHRPTRGDHGPASADLVAGPGRCYQAAGPGRCTVQHFPISEILFPIKISRNSFMFQKFIENKIKLKKYKVNFFRILLIRSLQ
jgi:hypothetical protein